jgi:hypothetical protein
VAVAHSSSIKAISAAQISRSGARACPLKYKIDIGEAKTIYPSPEGQGIAVSAGATIIRLKLPMTVAAQ